MLVRVIEDKTNQPCCDIKVNCFQFTHCLSVCRLCVIILESEVANTDKLLVGYCVRGQEVDFYSRRYHGLVAKKL